MGQITRCSVIASLLLPIAVFAQESASRGLSNTHARVPGGLSETVYVTSRINFMVWSRHTALRWIVDGVSQLSI